MKPLIQQLLARIYTEKLRELNVMEWASPIISFGDLMNSQVATVGLNPSNREFVDSSGIELAGNYRRFPTLTSANLGNWLDAGDEHFLQIETACRTYFTTNPYDLWFKKLNLLISETGFSYYNIGGQNACHLDLSPYATSCKWTTLTPKERTLLLTASGDFLGMLLRQSPVSVVILNGISVVKNFEFLAGTTLHCEHMPTWDLPRATGSTVKGLAFSGTIEQLAGIDLGRRIKVLGYNHNIQSSFGVTKQVIRAIKAWLGTSSEFPIYETAGRRICQQPFSLVG